MQRITVLMIGFGLATAASLATCPRQAEPPDERPRLQGGQTIGKNPVQDDSCSGQPGVRYPADACTAKPEPMSSTQSGTKEIINPAGDGAVPR